MEAGAEAGAEGVRAEERKAERRKTIEDGVVLIDTVVKSSSTSDKEKGQSLETAL